MSAQRRVLTLAHLYPSAAYPGAGPFVRDQVLQLASRHTMGVVSPLPFAVTRVPTARRVFATPKTSIEDGVLVLRPRLPDMPVGGPAANSWFWAFRLGPLLKRVYDDLDGDLVHAHFALPDGFAAARFASKADVPLVVTVWGSDVLVFGKMPAARRLLTSTFARAQAVIAVSNELSQCAAELGADPRRVFTVPPGVSYRPPVPRQAERERRGLAESEVCILWVGGLVPVKQPLEAVRAFEAFASESRASSARLVMVGDGPLRRVVSDMVRERNLDRTVRMLGQLPRDEVWSWQCAADVLINCSRSEGTPLAVLEALGAGTPVAAYALPGIRAAVDAVEGGTLAENRTPADLAAAIGSELSIDRDRDALAQEARARFDIAGVGRTIEAVYDTVFGAA